MEQNKRKDEFNWQPEPCDIYIVPEFKVKLPLSQPDRKYLSKTLSFINLNKHRRYADKCTIMPIPTTNKRYIDVCGSQKNVSRLIIFMEELGLIEVECEDYSYNNDKAKSKTYRYYIENEHKIIDLCKEQKIESKEISNRDTLVDTFQDVEFFDKSAVRFSSALTEIRKPENWSKELFESNLKAALYDNYPFLDYYQAMADYINDTYYEEYPELQIRYKPSFHWDTKYKFVKGIGIRATNQLVAAKNDKTEDTDFFGRYKEDILKKYGFNLHYDVKSSVPRITLSMNIGYWFNEGLDLYELIWKEYLERRESNRDTLVDTFSTEARQAVKSLFMPVYFEEHSQLNMCKNVRYSMLDQGNKEEVYAEMICFDDAVKDVLGYIYASEIFYHESNIYMEVLKELLDEGYFVWQVYDSWYARKDGVSQEEYERHISELVEEKANKYIDNM